jgi:hypothetical protein
MLWATSSVWWSFLLLWRNFWVSRSPICQSFSLNCWAIGFLLKKLLPMSICSGVFPILSCYSFKVSCLIGRSLIQFEFILVQGERHISSFSLLHVDSQVSPAPFVEDVVFSPSYELGSFVKNQMTIATLIYVWVFYSVSLVFMFAFVLVPYSFIAIAL